MRLGEHVAENERAGIENKYFVETSAFNDALEGRNSVFVGRKGAGKTANLLALASKLGEDRRNVICVIKPVGYEVQGIVKLLKQFRDRDTKGYAIESLWKFLLITELAFAVASP